jgi:hypothetical protein
MERQTEIKSSGSEEVLGDPFTNRGNSRDGENYAKRNCWKGERITCAATTRLLGTFSRTISLTHSQSMWATVASFTKGGFTASTLKSMRFGQRHQSGL